MTIQYLVKVRDRNELDFLKEYGHVAHVSKLSNIIVFEATRDVEDELRFHPNVESIRISDDFKLAQ